jgi:hypothetical protein
LFVSSTLAQKGTIAYVRNSTEIRLINPDGSNDRQLWTHPDLNQQLGIFDLAWKPDGTELAFSSAHEAASSLYVADIYSIRPDGSGLHRITNPPERAGFAKFPQGSVTVKILTILRTAKGRRTSSSTSKVRKIRSRFFFRRVKPKQSPSSPSQISGRGFK